MKNDNFKNLTASEKYQIIIKDIENGDPFEFIEHLNGINDLNYQNSIGDSLLHLCISYCNYPALVELLSRNVNLNLKNNSGLAPLHAAIWKGFLHLVAPLLKAGANVDITDSGGVIFIFLLIEYLYILQ